MDTSQRETKDFTYRLDEKIHVLTLHTAAAEAVRLCFVQLDIIFADAPAGQPLLLLSDIRESGIPPITVLWEHSRRLQPKYPQQLMISNAIVHNLSGVRYMTFMRVMELLAQHFAAQLAFFQAHEEKKAVGWLLAAQTTLKPG